MKRFSEVAAERKARQWDLFQLNRTVRAVTIVNNTLQELTDQQEEGIAVRVVKKERLGFSSASAFDDKYTCLDNALAAAEYGEKTRLQMPAASMDRGNGVYEGRMAVSLEEMVEQGSALAARLTQAGKGYLVSVRIGTSEEETRVYNSAGLHSALRCGRFHCQAGCQLADRPLVGRHLGLWSTGPDRLSEERLDNLLTDIGILEKAVPAAKGVYQVLFTPNAVMDLLFVLCQGLAGTPIAEGTSPLTGRLSEPVFSPHISIQSNPGKKAGSFAAPFDDEGSPGRTVDLIRQGVFEDYLLDLHSAGELQRGGNGHGRRVRCLKGVRSHAAPPRPLPVHLDLAPGTEPYRDLTAGMHTGVVIDHVHGWLLGAMPAGEFSGTIHGGMVIRRGRPQGRTDGLQLRGNVYTLLQDHVIALSRERHTAFSLGVHGRIPYMLCRDVVLY